jgi:hypothetical protein
VFYISSGTLSALCASIYYEKKRKFLWPLRGLLVVSILGHLGLLFCNNFFEYLFVSIISGVGVVGFIPLGTEACMEQGFPISETVSA